MDKFQIPCPFFGNRFRINCVLYTQQDVNTNVWDVYQNARMAAIRARLTGLPQDVVFPVNAGPMTKLMRFDIPFDDARADGIYVVTAFCLKAYPVGSDQSDEVRALPPPTPG